MRARSSVPRSGAEHRPQRLHRARVAHRVEHRRQAGQQQPHVGALRRQRARQRGDDVGQAAGLDEREDLGGDVQHAPHRPRWPQRPCGRLGVAVRVGRGAAAAGRGLSHRRASPVSPR
jgi:hypothetical protein